MLLVASLLALASATALQPPAQAVRDSIRAQRAEAMDSAAARRARRQPRHVALTPELESSAFRDAGAKELLARARVARLSQDSALAAYDAKTYQRMSIGMGLRRFGRDRLLMRVENAAKVHWDRAGGVSVEQTGKRAVFPMIKDADSDADLDELAPVPYFPGRETLWFPSSSFGVAKADVDDREFVHPLANGAEAYYRYATGDSMSVKLPDGKLIRLRELRITARKPDWHLFVGSFWFDAERGQLVRAAYRMSVDMDIWQVADEETKRELTEALERAKTDTSKDARAAVQAAQHDVDDAPPKWVKGMFSPMRASISAITVEYGLHEGRFWLPRTNVAEGDAQAGFLHVPLRFEESFKYDDVSAIGERAPAVRAAARVPAPSSAPAPRPALGAARTPMDSALALEPADDTLGTSANVRIEIGNDEASKRRRPITAANAQGASSATIDSTLRRLLFRADSLEHRADSLQQRFADRRALGDSTKDSILARSARERAKALRARAGQLARRTTSCATDSTYDAGVRRRYEGALAIRLRMPCDTTKLASSPNLPKSPYEAGEELFSSADRDALVNALDLSLQPGWAPQPLKFHSGLDLTRYNRVEGLSVGGSATSVLGAGYTAQAIARIGVADLVPNGELSIARSDGRRTLRLGAFHRLGVANDDWGSPLSLGASLSSLLYGRDEGFYYRTFGAELAGQRAAPLFGARVDWRLFGERQRTAGAKPQTQASLANAFGDHRFIDNIDAQQATVAGASADLARTFGADPTGLRLLLRSRIEGAAVKGAALAHGDPTGYGRLVLDGTLSRGLGPWSVALTGAAGGIAGDAPVQRQFYVGGLQTVRGQFARPTNAAGGVASGYQGDAFWLGRAELGTNAVGAKPVVYFDAGWAGPRADWQHPGRPLTGAGVGLSFMDGLIRTDLSRGIYPEKKVRFDVYLEARF